MDSPGNISGATWYMIGVFDFSLVIESLPSAAEVDPAPDNTGLSIRPTSILEYNNIYFYIDKNYV